MNLADVYRTIGVPEGLQGIVSFALLALGVAFLVHRIGKISIFSRVWKTIEEDILTNWRLALLGATGVILSIASGWTTWDGMRNFTNEPILSLMVTFGIQGVMLICAWLIGESFARGAVGESAGQEKVEVDQRLPKHQQAAQRIAHHSKPLIGPAVGFVALLGLAAAVGVFFASSELREVGATYGKTITWTALGLGTVLMVAFVLIAFSRAEILGPYARGTRVVLANVHLWLMFLACMTISVFFSFDSLFSTIFPKDERARAADLRAQNQVAGVVSDIGSTIITRRITEAEALFQNPAWVAFERDHLSRLAKASHDSQGEIERYFVAQMEERRRAIAQQQERITTAQSGQVGLASKKVTLTDELARLKGERPALAAELAEKKTELDNRAKQIDAKRVEAMAEDKGVEGTGKVGKGPAYRQIMGDMAKLQDYYKIQEDRVRDATKRLGSVDTRIAQIERELAAIDGELAKLKGEAQTAEQRIKVAEESTSAEESGSKIDPARVLPAFERARVEFRQEPTAERLAGVQRMCMQLLNAMGSTPTTKEKVRGIDCDPKQASEAAARVFALNEGIVTFAKNCAGGDKLPTQGGADVLFGFARRCLQDSGLAGKDTEKLRDRINHVELNRDDKAHRFVVTWNAFLDGNRLAYLALAIALAIDGLVFMSGLFGANAVASPLAGSPEAKHRALNELNDIIDSTLLPHKAYAAELVLNVMHPVRMQHDSKYSVFVDLNDFAEDDEGRRQLLLVRNVLTAAAGLQLVRERDEGRRHLYYVRRELFEYLAKIRKQAYDRVEDGAFPPRCPAIPRLKSDLLETTRLDRLAAGASTEDDPKVTGFSGPEADRALEASKPAAQLPYQGGKAKAGDEHPGGWLKRKASEAGGMFRRNKDGGYTQVQGHDELDEQAPQARARKGEPKAAAVAQAGSAQRAASNGAGHAAQPRGNNEAMAVFLEAIGIALPSYELLADQELRAAADDAARELDELSKSDAEFASRIDAAEQNGRMRLQKARDRITQEASRDPAAARRIHELAEQLDNDNLVLVGMLMPGGDYRRILLQIQHRMEQESGGVPKHDIESLRYKALKEHAAEIISAQRSEPQGWRQIADSISRFRLELLRLNAIAGHAPAPNVGVVGHG